MVSVTLMTIVHRRKGLLQRGKHRSQNQKVPRSIACLLRHPVTPPSYCLFFLRRRVAPTPMHNTPMYQKPRQYSSHLPESWPPSHRGSQSIPFPPNYESVTARRLTDACQYDCRPIERTTYLRLAPSYLCAHRLTQKEGKHSERGLAAVRSSGAEVLHPDHAAIRPTPSISIVKPPIPQSPSPVSRVTAQHAAAPTPSHNNSPRTQPTK